MAIVYTTNVGVGKELSKDCSLPVPTVGYTNSDEGGLPFRMTRKSIPTTLLLLIEFHGLLLKNRSNALSSRQLLLVLRVA